MKKKKSITFSHSLSKNYSRSYEHGGWLLQTYDWENADMVITRCATADKFWGKISSNFCFVGSYTPTNSADALLMIVAHVQLVKA